MTRNSIGIFPADAAWSRSSGIEPARHFTLLLLPEFSMIAFAALIEPLRLANRISGQDLYSWTLASADAKAVVASNGITVGVDAGIADIRNPGSIIVCGGINGDRFLDSGTFAWLRRASAMGSEIGATCTGSFVLARSGVLAGYRCTVHWEHLASWREIFPDIEVTGELFTIDRKRATCAGGTASADMMLNRIAGIHGEELATMVSEQMLHHKIRSGGDLQNSLVQLPMGAERDDLRAAICCMLDNLETPLDLQTVADRIGKSRRNLERVFRKYLNCSPAKHYLRLRLERARQLLHQTHMPVVQVALNCGFISTTHFSKCYREHFGLTPKADKTSQHSRRYCHAA